MITREHCLTLDQNDPLHHLRNEFVLPPDLIYLDGNSLGVAPKAAVTKAKTVLENEWAQGLITSWNKAGWFDLPIRLGSMLAPLIGAKAEEVAITDTISINVFKVLSAALEIQRSIDPKRKVIISERSNFPSDLYIAEGVMKMLDQGYELRLFDSPEELPSLLTSDVAVTLITQVNYRTGYLFDMQELTRTIHAAGALAIWDLAHSAGAVPVDLNAAQADFAIGCTYKYLNGGPGSPGFVWVAPKHLTKAQNPLSGWWAHRNPFQMQTQYDPAVTIRRFLCGTQPILSLSLIECGLAVFHQTDMSAIRKKSLALTDLFITLIEQECADVGFTLVTPREHSKRGSQVSLAHPEGYAAVQALIDLGVIGDYREPEVMRFGFTPLYIRYIDVWDAVQLIRKVFAEKIWAQAKYQQRNQVT